MPKVMNFGENFLEFNLSGGLIVKVFFVLFLVFYVIFSLMILRQVQLMERTLPLPLSPILTFLAIIQIGVALALLLFVLGAF